MQTLLETCHPGSRYDFDFGPCSYTKGWVQIDSGQDASYFGSWLHPDQLKLCTFTEGDVRISQAETLEDMREELERMDRWNREMGFGPIAIDPGLDRREQVVSRLSEIGVEGMVH